MEVLEGSRFNPLNMTSQQNQSDVNISSWPVFDVMRSPLDDRRILAALVTAYIIVFLACFFGNIIVLVVIAVHRQMRTITNFFLANLAATDLCVSLFCVLPNLFTYISPFWRLGEVMCKMYYFIQAMSSSASISILTIISIERFIAIIYPIKCKQLLSVSLLISTVTGIWVSSAAAGSPFLFIYGTVTIPPVPPSVSETSFCLQIRPYNTKVYALSSFLLFYIMPLSLMIVVYTSISLVLWRTSQGTVGTSCGTAGTSCGTPRSVARAGTGSAEERGTSRGYRKMVPSGVVVVVTNADSEPSVLDASRMQQEKVESNKETIADSNPSDKPPNYFEEKNLNKDKPVSVKKHNHSMKETSPGGKSATSSGDSLQDITSEVGFKLAEASRISPGRRNLLAKDSKKVASTENALTARRKVIRLLIALVVAFACCVLPYHVRIILLAFGGEGHPIGYWHQLIPPFCFLTYYLNSALNPLLYAFLSEKFRKCFHEVFTCRLMTRRQQNVQNRQSFTMRTLNSVA